MRKKYRLWKRLIAITLSIMLIAGAVPTAGLSALAADETKELVLDNGFIKTEVSEKNGGFAIRTVKGDKINKDDNYKHLLYHSDEDDTSFTSFQVKRGDEVKEYIFGGDYEGSSDVRVTKANEEIKAVWSVDDLEFTQTLSLVNSGANEHGAVYISYSVVNSGAPAEIKARILLDTALGYQDYAYYNVGGETTVEQEITLEEGGYNKSFYAVDNPANPAITAYTINAAVNNTECIPYQTTFAHWNHLASTVFDYTADQTMTFTNPNNKEFLTADSAYALYFDMGSVATDGTSVIATNYGVFSNEQVEAEATAAVNITAPSAMELTEDKTAYKNDGNFTVNTSIENVSTKTYERVRVVVYTTGGIEALDGNGNPTGATYDNPYSIDYINYVPEQIQTTEWKFKAAPQTEGTYAKIHYKVYDVSDDATLNTDKLLANNLLGEGRCYVLCPGSVNGIPEVQFTSASPEILYNQGTRNLYITGSNFSMLRDKGSYKLMISRVDGQSFNGASSVQLPAENIKIDEDKNTMTLVMNNKNPGVLPEGQYQLTFDYTDSTKADLTAPALRFAVKEDTKYKNNSYGMLAVVKQYSEESHDYWYDVVTFENETEYQEALEAGTYDRANVLLEFRGSFTAKQMNYGHIVYTGVSLGKDDNVMTLNNCLDIEDGTTTITDKDGSVKVDFDAKIYTTGERTSVWNGVCALTELEAGGNYGLIPYAENGERESYNFQTITLLWPSVGQAAQNLLGLLMDFKYGELGAIYHEDAEETRVVAFGASMDLSFIIPKGAEAPVSNEDLLGDAYNAASHGGNLYGDDLRAINKKIPYNTNTVDTNATANNGMEMGTDTGDSASGGDGDSRSACIQIDDVLFGGEYLGVNLTVALGLPSYIEGTPGMEAILTVKTVGDWEIGASGVADFEVFFMEGEIYIKSYNNIPVPDKLRFYVGGVTPGINVDGVGVLWLQGAGGGIDSLYDTIFLKESIPPLQLIIEAQFSIMQVISAKAQLALSLRGIGVELSDGKVANAIPVLTSAQLRFDWYPEFYFMSSVNVSILDAITGSGYIVVEDDGFFEFFVRAALSIPNEIPVVGGMTLADASLGANAEKVWGLINVLAVDVGLVYYWGGDIDWGGGVEAYPTYPELAGMDSGRSARTMALMEDVPVYYDAETNRTLYVRAGTNMVNSTATVVNKNLRASARAVAANQLETSADGKTHILSLAPKTKDEILVLEWSADSMEAAKAYVQEGNIQITNPADAAETYAIHLLNHDEEATTQTEANANLTYNETEQKATLAITFTDSETAFDKQWSITTKEVSSVILYDLNPMPKLTEETTFTISSETNQAEAVLHGSELDQYNTISFVAVPLKTTAYANALSEIPFLGNLLKSKSANVQEENKEEARLIYRVESETGFADGQTISFDLPEDMRSGEYQIRIVASDNEGTYQTSIEKAASYTNAAEPDAVKAIQTQNGGDYTFDVSVEAEGNDFDGYMLTVYDNTGKAVDTAANLMYMADGRAAKYNEDGTIDTEAEAVETKAVIRVGGQYSYEETVKGLLAENEYTVGVRTWKQLESGMILYSAEQRGSAVQMEAPVETTFTVTANETYTEIEETRNSSDGEEIHFHTPVYQTNALELTLTADSAKVQGTWILDGGNKEGTIGKVEESTKEIKVSFKDLEEGTHTFEFRGKNEHGDSVAHTYVFGVDTLGPRLLLETPVNGSLFSASTTTLNIRGVTDKGTKLSVHNLTNGETALTAMTVSVDREGRFTVDVPMAAKLLTQTLQIVATDVVGNQTVKEVTVASDALGSIQELQLWSETEDVTNKNLVPSEEGITTYALSLKAKLSNGEQIDLNDNNLIEWQQFVAEGEVTLTEVNGGIHLRVPAEAQGMIKARFLVSDLGANSVVASFGLGNQTEQPDKKILTTLAEGELKVSGDVTELTYGEPLSRLALDATEAIFKGADGNTVEGTVEWQIPEEIPAAGLTEAAWVFIPNDGENYHETTGTIEIEVAKATPTIITAPAAVQAEITYHPTQTLEEMEIDNAGSVKWTVGGVQQTVEGTWSFQNPEQIPTTDIGQYTAVFTPADSLNYNTVTTQVGITVQKATPVIAEVPEIAALVYGQSVGESALTEGRADYSSNDTTEVDGRFVWETTSADQKPAVSDSNTTNYTICFIPEDDVNYNSVTQIVKIVVNPLKAEFTWHGTDNRFYQDGREVTAEITNKVGEDIVETTVEDGNLTEVGTHTARIIGVVGEHAANYTLDGYTESERTKEYTIRRSQSEVTAASYKEETAQSVFTYGDSITVKGNVSEIGKMETKSFVARVLRAVGSLLGGPKNDQVALFVGEVQITDYADVKDDGTYTVIYNTTDKQMQIGDDQKVTVQYTGNANRAEANTELVISLKQKEITAELAGSAEKIYDGTTTIAENHALRMEVNGVEAEDVVEVTAKYVYGSKDVGTTWIHAENLTLGGADANWYHLSTVSDSKEAGTIEKKALTITAKDAFVTYGEDAPLFEAAYDGFVEGEDPQVLQGVLAFDCTYTKGSSVTEAGYTVMPKGLSSQNYEITFAEGTLMVTKAVQSISYAVAQITKEVTEEAFVHPLTQNIVFGEITYTSGNPEVAEVAADGSVTILKEGTTVITAKVSGSDDYEMAETSYTLEIVKAAEDDTDDKDEGNTGNDTDNKEEDKTDGDGVGTGDTSKIWIWSMVGLIAATVVMILPQWREKSKRK